MKELLLLKRDIDLFASAAIQPVLPADFAEQVLRAAEERRPKRGKAVGEPRWGWQLASGLAATTIVLFWFFGRGDTSEAPSIVAEGPGAALGPPMGEGSHRKVDLEDPAPVEHVEATAPSGAKMGPKPSGGDRAGFVAAEARVEPATPGSREWRALSDEGKFLEALRAAKSVGFDEILASADADDLLALGEAASYAGDLSAASRTFEALSSRFAQSEEAGTATFRLARINVRLGKPTQSLVLLSSYLKDRPQGKLAREARGLRLEIMNQTKDPGSRDHAQVYLRLHPDGPHSALARTMLENAR